MRLPRTIAGYEFVQRLGAGSFGTVYRAVLRGDLGFEQEVAIKVLDAVRARLNPDLLAGLVNEARILSRVQHPNIVQSRHFLAISDEALGETWMLVMELVRGQPLRRVMRHEGPPLPITAPLQVLSELADGLHFAHRLTDERGWPVGLVHRDLKPENIHVTNEGRIKILDFGIAWAKRRMGDGTAAGRIVGTPLYMSPEQLRGEPLDGRSDLYALGCIGFEMLAGEPYVPGPDGLEAVAAARSVRFRQRERRLRDSLQERYGLGPESATTTEVVSLLRDLLARDPADRPDRGGEVFDRLEGLDAHRPSVGRGHLRRAVERLNVRDDEGETETGRHVPVRSTRVLQRGTHEPTTAVNTAVDEGPHPPLVTAVLVGSAALGLAAWLLLQLL